MATTYHPLKFALTNGQKKKLQKAYASKTAVDLLLLKFINYSCADDPISLHQLGQVHVF